MAVILAPADRFPDAKEKMNMRRFSGLLPWLFASSSCLASEPVTVPIAFDTGFPVVTLNFDGQAIPFVLDTGSSRTFHLAPGVAKQLPGLVFTGNKFKSMDAAGHVQEDDEVSIANLSVNGLAFGKTTGVIAQPWGLTIGKGQGPVKSQSILGLGFFDGRRVIIDYPSKRLTIADADDKSVMQRVAGWTPFPYERSHAGQVLVLSSGKADYRMVLDSPSNLSIVKAKLAEGRGDAVKCELDLGPGRVCESVGVSLPGGSPIKALLIDLPDQFPDDGLLGQDFFFQYAVFIDGKNRVVMLRERQ